MEQFGGLSRMIYVPRNPREHRPGAVLHLISRGVDRCKIYECENDYRFFLIQLQEAFEAHGVSLFAHCLMPNHFHLLAALSEKPVGVAMHQLLTRHSLYFNRVYGRVGHLFQNRFKSFECLDLGYLIQLATYIHMNPVRAGLARTPADWPWSSHQEYASGQSRYTDLSRLAELTEMTPEELRARYMERVQEPDVPTKRDDSLSDLIRRAAQSAGVRPEEVVSGRRGGSYTRAKTAVVNAALREGYSLMAIARALNCSHASASALRSKGKGTGVVG